MAAVLRAVLHSSRHLVEHVESASETKVERGRRGTGGKWCSQRKGVDARDEFEEEEADQRRGRRLDEIRLPVLTPNLILVVRLFGKKRGTVRT
jgi:hypothetical protein